MKPVVASYVSDFLKPDMWHVYRQISGQKNVEPWVFTHKREGANQFPFPEKRLVVLPKPRLRWWRRLVHKHFIKSPWQLYRWELRHLLLELKRADAKVLHVYFGHIALHFLSLIKAFPHPVVVSFHGADAGVDMNKPSRMAMMRDVFTHATLIQVRSQSLANDLVKLGCNPDKIRIQRTGIPLEEWTFEPREVPENGAWRLLQSCRLIDKKGLDTTLTAFAAIKKEQLNAELIIAGNGPLQEELEKLAAELGVTNSVRFTGFLSQHDLREEVAKSHFFVHPSRTTADGNREGIPNSMLEAMASGASVVATRHGGIPEAVKDGESGLLVDENDAAGLAHAVLTLMRDPARNREIAINARRSIEQSFDRQGNIHYLEQTYQELIQNARGTSAATS